MSATTRRGRPRRPPAPAGPELETIRRARALDGRTDAELARAAGLAPGSVSRIIAEGRDVPLSTARALLSALGMRWRDLDTPG